MPFSSETHSTPFSSKRCTIASVSLSVLKIDLPPLLVPLFKLLNDNKKWLEVVVAITRGKLKDCPYYIHFNFIISLRTQSYLKGHLSNPINK